MASHAMAGEPEQEGPPVRRGRRRHIAAAEVEDLFDRRRTPVAELPDPTPLVLNLARCAIEILAGVRDPEQVARWLEPDAYTRLVTRAVLAQRSRVARGRAVTVPSLAIVSCRIATPSPDTIEAVVVVRTPARVRAVAARLIGIDGRWRAADLAVL